MTRKITIEDVATYPRPGTVVPTRLAFSPDGAHITYLLSAEGALRQQLYVYDPATEAHRLLLDPSEMVGEAELSLEERLRRERTRTRAVGVTDYAWAKEASKLLVPLSDGVYVLDDLVGSFQKAIDVDDGPILDPQFSPDGTHIAFVRHDELYVVSSTGGEWMRLAEGAEAEGVVRGLAEYMAQEEMDRPHGFWWSPDSTRLAFTEVDETQIPVYRIVHQGKAQVGPEAQEDHRYPFAGQKNARVRLSVVPVKAGETVWMDLGDNEDIYLARVAWSTTGALVAQIENREQTELQLIAFDPATGEGHLLLTERSDTWINLHHMLRFLDDGRFIWASERTGFMHLYLYDQEGRLIRAITEGAWMVDDLLAVDEAAGRVYFTATRKDPRERHLYGVSLAGGPPERLTHALGHHDIVIDHANQRFVDTYGALDQPPQITLRSLSDGEIRHEIYAAEDERVEALALTPPELVSFQSRDGETLYAAVYVPEADEYGPGPYPLVVSVYGGPHAQRVARDWSLTVDLRAQYLRQLGFAVLKVDNRGSARRGLTFEGAIKGRLGDVEVWDQVDGVRWAVEHGTADPERVGIIGWSYGGYMALMGLARAPETFKVAVAGAPVTDWDGYDTHYTERYMGHPRVNVEGYTNSSVMAYVEEMQGRLLLIHGLIDENVHFRHTARLINALIRARKTYDLLLFPDERHMPRRLEDRVYMETRIRDYFLDHLREG